MKKECKQSVNQILYQLRRTDETKEVLEHDLVEKAAQQEYIEGRYNDLVNLAEQGINFLNQVHEGDIITSEWVAEGQRLVALANEIVQSDFS